MRLLLTLALVLVAGGAQADTACGAALTMLSFAAQNYHEAPTAGGDIDGKPVMLTVSPEGTWTIFVSPTPGVLCSFASGANWKVVIAPLPPS